MDAAHNEAGQLDRQAAALGKAFDFSKPIKATYRGPRGHGEFVKPTCPACKRPYDPLRGEPIGGMELCGRADCARDYRKRLGLSKMPRDLRHAQREANLANIKTGRATTRTLHNDAAFVAHKQKTNWEPGFLPL